MMAAVRRMQEQGVEIGIAYHRGEVTLAFHAPDGWLTPERGAWLRAHLPEITEALRQEDRVVPCVTCRESIDLDLDREARYVPWAEGNAILCGHCRSEAREALAKAQSAQQRLEGV